MSQELSTRPFRRRRNPASRGAAAGRRSPVAGRHSKVDDANELNVFLSDWSLAEFSELPNFHGNNG